MIHEFSKYMISCFEKKEQIEENELPKLQQPMPDATKQVKAVFKILISEILWFFQKNIDFQGSAPWCSKIKTIFQKSLKTAFFYWPIVLSSAS